MGDSLIHRLNARAKLVAVLCYTIVLISFDRYSVANLTPMAVLPLALLWFGGVPVRVAPSPHGNPKPIHSYARADRARSTTVPRRP